MDALDKWFLEQSSTPLGSILLFLLVFLTRVALDRWGKRRASRRKARDRKHLAHG